MLNTSDNHWLNQTPTSNRFSSLSDEEETDHMQEAATDIRPKPPPIFVSDVFQVKIEKAFND
jgi:hypothetical protein